LEEQFFNGLAAIGALNDHILDPKAAHM
jgi:hypothetical protein